MNDKPTVVHIKALYKNFGSLKVLKGSSLEVKKGDVVCIVGPSGSGKSTFLRCNNLLLGKFGLKIRF